MSTEKADALDMMINLLRETLDDLTEKLERLDKLEDTMRTFINIVNEADLKAMQDRFREENK